MDYHCCNHRGHESGANEKGISVLEGACAGLEFKNEIVVDPCTLPHEEIAPVHKQVKT